MKKWILGHRCLFVVILLAMLFRVIGILPNTYHPDEPYTVDISRNLFWGVVKHMDFDPHGYKYGGLIFYLNSVVYLPLYILSIIKLKSNILLSVRPDGFLNIELIFFDLVRMSENYINFSGRFISAVFGVSSVVLVYGIVKKLFPFKAAVISALVLAINPFHVQHSRYITTDVLSLFFILLALYFLINLMQSGKLKWYILSGIAIGVQSTIRYFPVSLLIFPLAALFDNRKTKIWFLKVGSGLIGVVLGVFIGVPYLFLNQQSRLDFARDFQVLILPWYSTGVSGFLIDLFSFLKGNVAFPDWHSLLPVHFYPKFANYLFFVGFGKLASILSLLGMGYLLLKRINKFALLVTVPAATFIYVSCYITGGPYERLILPMVPFLAIFLGVLLSRFPKKLSFTVALLFFALFPQLKETIFASMTCAQESVFNESKIWIDNNIPYDARIAAVPLVSIPSKPNAYRDQLNVGPRDDFFMEEIAAQGYNYFFYPTSFIYYYSPHFEYKYFVPPRKVVDNYYINLALHEYRTRSQLLYKIAKAKTCEPSETYFYHVSPVYDADNSPEVVKAYSFDKPDDIDLWSVESPEEATTEYKIDYTQVEDGRKGILVYPPSYKLDVPPRIYSERININPDTVYGLRAWIKSGGSLDKENRDGFMRLDFYSSGGNILLPGKVVALTPRLYGKAQWKEVVVWAMAPHDASFAVISFQTSGDSSWAFYIDDIQLLKR